VKRNAENAGLRRRAPPAAKKTLRKPLDTASGRNLFVPALSHDIHVRSPWQPRRARRHRHRRCHRRHDSQHGRSLLNQNFLHRSTTAFPPMPPPMPKPLPTPSPSASTPRLSVPMTARPSATRGGVRGADVSVVRRRSGRFCGVAGAGVISNTNGNSGECGSAFNPNGVAQQRAVLNSIRNSSLSRLDWISTTPKWVAYRLFLSGDFHSNGVAHRTLNGSLLNSVRIGVTLSPPHPRNSAGNTTGGTVKPPNATPSASRNPAQSPAHARAKRAASRFSRPTVNSLSQAKRTTGEGGVVNA